MSTPDLTLEEALAALKEARRGLARWQAWHVRKFEEAFPPKSEQPEDWMAWISAAAEWGVAEADWLFPGIDESRRQYLIITYNDTVKA